MRLRDCVVVITGASSGIGRATAIRLARKGARLILAARGTEALQTLAKECRKRGGKAIAVTTDTTDAEAMEALAARAVEEFGRLDAWVNNAAVSVFGRMTEIPLQDFQRVLDVNITGYVHGARAALPRLRAQGSGVLINVASIVGEVSQPYTAPYSMSKAAVRALGVSLRSELRLDGVTGVKVCTILPAAIDTPFFQHAANYTGRKVVAMPPVYTPARVAKSILKALKRPRRELVVGPAGRYMVLNHRFLPRRVEDAMAIQVDKTHLSRKHPAENSTGNLYQPSNRVRAASVRGGWHGRRRTAQRRVFTALAVGAGAAVLRRFTLKLPQ
ncbi:SDR family oxidoreductase [Arthrobacter sp. ISL-72]|uniref:SDR family oxidoreductase n=1 Tax=Arthrobacter sp. ISL-72 TaxID=2819114 RepID=UPI001BE89A64|nr:SDR family oxidoreductase [Arthrobacter sp. ISL-72]MBT2596986.1 SDR family NAD(P)-dependent oxidoreductase [Arthrobacter sp. ISL-72]